MRKTVPLILGLALAAACSTPRPVRRPGAYVSPETGGPATVATAQARIRSLEKEKEAYLKAAQEKAAENESLKTRIKDLESQVAHLKRENDGLRAKMFGSAEPAYSQSQSIQSYRYDESDSASEPTFAPDLTGAPTPTPSAESPEFRPQPPDAAP